MVIQSTIADMVPPIVCTGMDTTSSDFRHPQPYWCVARRDGGYPSEGNATDTHLEDTQSHIDAEDKAVPADAPSGHGTNSTTSQADPRLKLVYMPV